MRIRDWLKNHKLTDHEVQSNLHEFESSAPGSTAVINDFKTKYEAQHGAGTFPWAAVIAGVQLIISLFAGGGGNDIITQIMTMLQKLFPGINPTPPVSK